MKETELKKPGYKVSLCKSTINRYVANNMSGVIPLLRGPESIMPSAAMTLLALAFESYCQINQVNNDPIERKFLIILLNQVCCMGSTPKKSILDQVLKLTTVSLDATYAVKVEERRNNWLTYTNLKLWFDNWKICLVEYGFASQDEDGNLVFTEAQLRRILNLDETEVSLDGTNTSAGGRQSVIFVDPNLPLCTRSASKSSRHMTAICGSNAAGEILPHHYQLVSEATEEARKRTNVAFLTYQQDTISQFGWDAPMPRPCTIGANEKGGMNDIEFAKYLESTIYPLYPDMRDEPGFRVLAKVDSGPGRFDQELLHIARSRGLYLYPSAPNCTHVQQETDRNYGLYKSIIRKNLEDLCKAAVKDGKSFSFGISAFLLLIYGGKCNDTGVECENAVQRAFNKEANLNAWNEVGAVGTDETGRRTVTMKCINDKKVRHDGTNKSDPNYNVYQDIQMKNIYACTQLTLMGYNGDILKIMFKEDKIRARLEAAAPVTQPQSRARQEALAWAVTAGERFFATGGGGMANSNDAFKAMDIKKRQPRIDAMVKDKKLREEYHQRNAVARPILDRLKNELQSNVDKLNNTELTAVLKAKGIPVTKMGKVADKKKLLKSILEADDGEIPSNLQEWTSADEESLEKLKNQTIEDIDESQTSFGIFKAEKKKDLERFYRTLSNEDRDAFWERMSKIDVEERQNAATEE